MSDVNGGTLTITQTLGLIDDLRKKGVVSFSGFGVSLVLGPAEPDVAVLPETEERVEVKGKLGKDGLTKQEQIELYGRVIDAE